ncbi:MAG: serine/threonine-protein kinase [Elusimicrobia bacterium]|nr:serine/threonine-protein kinase [Elusimicrobiota bacterium]
MHAAALLASCLSVAAAATAGRPAVAASTGTRIDASQRELALPFIEQLLNLRVDELGPMNISGEQVDRDIASLIAEIDRTEQALPVDRARALRAEYRNYADLDALDRDHYALSKPLEAACSGLRLRLTALEKLIRLRTHRHLPAVVARGAKSDADEVGRQAKEWTQYRRMDAFWSTDCVGLLREQRGEYSARRRAILSERSAARRCAAAAGAFFCLAAGAGFWAFRRHSRSAGGAGRPRLIGRNYRLEREIGRGGMGLVFEATDLALGRKVAVKQLREELKQDPRELEQFLAEARIVAGLKHPNIVGIDAIVQDPDETYLIFELIEGRGLDRALAKAGKLDLRSVCSLARQVASALDYAHAQSVIHRALKPANVMVTPQGAAKVTDFGLACRASMTVAYLTQAENWGTPQYMAPEAELGETSPVSDVFSLGALVYEAVTGNIPFPGPNFLAQKREKFWRPASQVVSVLPRAIDEVLARAMHPEPAARFRTAGQLAQALDSLVSA